MKKLLIISAGLLFIFSSCNSKKEEGGTLDKEKKNIEACRTVAKAFETGDVSGIDAVVADDFVDHTDRGDMGRDSLKAMITMMHGSDPTMKMETLQEFSNDDYVATWYRFKGTSDGSMGPKGPYDVGSIELVKFNKDNKAIEHWGFMEMRDMMKMMGKEGSMPPPTDTTSHM